LDDGTQEFEIEPGEHRLHIKTATSEFESPSFTLKKGGKEHVTVAIVDAQIVGANGRNSLFRLPLIPDQTSDASQTVGIELIRNGGCEEPSDGTSIPGWISVSGGWKPRQDPIPHEGSSFFMPGDTATAELVQDVSLEDYKTEIAESGYEFHFSGVVRCWPQRHPDSSQVIVEYRDSENRRTLDVYDSGTHRDQHRWRPISDMRIPPRGTGWVRIRLISIRHEGTNNDGYYDALSLKLVPHEYRKTRRLAAGQWHNLLDMVRLPDHAIFGGWKLLDGALVSDGAPVAVLMAPVVARGHYELRCDFTRWASNDTVGWNLPVGDQSVCLFVSGWNGVVHGLSDIDGIDATRLDERTGAVKKPGIIENTVRHRLYAKVVVNGNQAEITATLDDQEIVSWSGLWKSLTPWPDRILPVADAFGVHSSPGCVAHFHTLELRVDDTGTLFQLGDDWASPLARVASEPPAEIIDSCVTWNGRKYCFSEETMTFVMAQNLARQYRGRIVTISSLDEDTFLRTQAPGRGFWLAGWRRVGSNQFRDERNRVLRFYRWVQGEPGNHMGQDALIGTRGDGRGWEDVWRYRNPYYACIEWGEEYAEGASDEVVIAE
jgi:hypothetical protein